MSKIHNSSLSGWPRKLRRIIDTIEVWGILFTKERKFKTKLSLSKRIRAWRLGFLSDTYIQYFIPGGDNNYKQYLSDYDRWKRIPVINAKYGILLADKLLFFTYFKPYSQYIPKIHFFIMGNTLYHPNYQTATASEMITVLKQSGKLIAKPRSGFGGRGVVKIVAEDGVISFSGDKVTEEQLVTELEKLDSYIICEFAQQHPYSENIYNGSVNTLRMITLFDPSKGKATLIGVAHRFGSSTTGLVDNWTNGGISAAVSHSDGILGKAAQNPKGGNLLWIDAHPDSGNNITGVKIPHWEETKAMITEMAAFVPYCRYIGWDVVITQNSFMVLEANDSPDVHIIQIHTPLLTGEVELFKK